MTFVLKTVVAISAGEIVALSLDAAARPIHAAIPTLSVTLAVAGLALLVFEALRRWRFQGSRSDSGRAEPSPEEDKASAGGGIGFDRPSEVSGTVAKVTGPSRGIGRVLPGFGEKVKVTLIADGGRTIYMEFGARWAGEFRVGDSLRGTGWVDKVNAHSVHLVDCTLMGMEPPT